MRSSRARSESNRPRPPGRRRRARWRVDATSTWNPPPYLFRQATPRLLPNDSGTEDGTVTLPSTFAPPVALTDDEERAVVAELWHRRSEAQTWLREHPT